MDADGRRRIATRRSNTRHEITYELDQSVTAGAQDFTWDGRDQAGQLVPPGLYLLELYLDGDAHQQRVRRLISVVY